MANVEIRREFAGHFQSYVDGQKARFEIINGSLGMSGRGRNTYGIKNTEAGTIKWVGSLASCKKLVTHWLAKNCTP